MSGMALAVPETQGDADAGRQRGLSIDPHWWAGALLAGATLLAVGLQLGHSGLERAARAAPTDPAFWLTFVCWYLLAPTFEWVIFRRLWRLPASGMAALARKLVATELVLGYSGEAQFYLWARRHANLAHSPFGAVKDVAVLSAMTANVATLALMAANWSFLAPALAGTLGRAFVVSAGTIALGSFVAFLFRRRLFSLPAADLVGIAATHAVRIVLSIALLGILWHLLLPGLPVRGLVAFATLRMMLSRLPFLPAKEVVFAGLVMAMLGRGAAVVPAVAMLGSLVVGTHVGVAICLTAVSLLGRIAK